jgi:transcriptional regulator with XRE-family HTH domain
MASTLRDLRELALLSQSELAQKLKVSKQAITEWEHGRAKPSPDHRRRLLEVLNATGHVNLTSKDLLDAINETAHDGEKELAAIGQAITSRR